MIEKIRCYIQFTRPFTLLAPALGILSGSFIALGADPPLPKNSLFIYFQIIAGGFIAAFLNAAANGINQIYDFEIDCKNKSERPLPSGRMNFKEAWIITIFLYILTVGSSFLLSLSFAMMVCIAAFCTIIYSVPPIRTKRHWLAATLTIAIPRGLLLKIAGWAVLKEIDHQEPWYVGTIFGLFLLGATTTKDYADIEGDRSQNCITLPIRFGVRKSAFMISPFFIFPFLMFPLGVYLEILTGNALVLYFLGISLSLWGSYVVYLLLKDPDALTATENHPSWRHMYLMMIYAQLGLAYAYYV